MRLIFPAITLAAAFNLRKGWLVALAPFWVLDVGLVCCVSWLGYTLLIRHSEFWQQLITILKTWLAVLVAYYIVAGDLPHGIFTSVTEFGRVGYGMLPMPLFGWWWLYVVVLFYGYYRFFKSPSTLSRGTLLMTCLLGTGSFFYYVGRSSNWNLVFLSIWPALILILTLRETILRPVALMSLGVAIFIAPTAGKVYLERNAMFKPQTPPAIVKDFADFIKDNTSRGEKIIIIAPTASCLYDITGTIPAISMSPTELFYESELREYLADIKAMQIKVFVANMMPPTDHLNKVDWLKECDLTITKKNNFIALLEHVAPQRGYEGRLSEQ